MGAMEDKPKQISKQPEQELKFAGYVQKAVYDTPKHRMKELTVLPASLTAPLSAVEMMETQAREMIDHQLKLARIMYKGNSVMLAKINKFAKEYELPTEEFRMSMYGHNRSIKGEHLNSGREAVEGEIATQNTEESEEPVAQ
jgi:hypothetical protein